MSAMLEIKNLSKTFNKGTINEKIALDHINLTLNEGDFVTVIGGNGAGKSTMLNAVAGVWPVDEGAIIVDGNNITGLPDFKRATLIGRVFQDPMLGSAPDMQIIENLALAARRGKRRTLKWGVTKKEKEDYKEQLKILDLGLEDRLTQKVGWLSGGCQVGCERNRPGKGAGGRAERQYPALSCAEEGRGVPVRADSAAGGGRLSAGHGVGAAGTAGNCMQCGKVRLSSP